MVYLTFQFCIVRYYISILRSLSPETVFLLLFLIDFSVLFFLEFFVLVLLCFIYLFILSFYEPAQNVKERAFAIETFEPF